MTKQETIAKAYGEHWETVKDFVDKEGWLFTNGQKFIVNFKYQERGFGVTHRIRPKSLAGIENNRGWNILKGMKNEIHHDGDIWILNKRGNIELWLESQFLPIGYATHWKPIVKPEPPIY